MVAASVTASVEAATIEVASSVAAIVAASVEAATDEVTAAIIDVAASVEAASDEVASAVTAEAGVGDWATIGARVASSETLGVVGSTVVAADSDVPAAALVGGTCVAVGRVVGVGVADGEQAARTTAKMKTMSKVQRC